MLIAEQATDLGTVSAIHIGSMGQSDDAERFRMLLEEELNKVHFRVTSDAGRADASLTGALSVRVYADSSVARATVVLKGAQEAALWRGDFQPRRTCSRKDTVRLRAEDVAKELRKAVDKALRSGSNRK
jgi:hypothetical protein